MNQPTIDAMGNVHTIDVITPEIADTAVVAEAVPIIQINPPEERQRVPAPGWMVQIVNRQWRLAKRYHKARKKALMAYNVAVDELDEINSEFGTDFTLARLLEEFKGYLAYVPDEDEDE